MSFLSNVYIHCDACDGSRFDLTLRSDSGEVYATFDGHVSFAMLQGDVVPVRKSRNKLKLVSLPGHNYFHVLRHKLRWAERPPPQEASRDPIVIFVSVSRRGRLCHEKSQQS